uniref:Uncharacterized protein n=1 Tax=Ananas comosus var. bracteatus TaxID=296719 RepID=A0A6V7Q4D0_ANACO|nr:unnamed protein product [Ananas comosus var. bracteatus]
MDGEDLAGTHLRPGSGPRTLGPSPFPSDRDADLRRLRLRRRRRLRRRDLGGHPAQAPPRRHPCHHRASQIELESIQLDAITASDSTGGNDGIDGTTSGIDRLRLIRSERLPGAVVQARERLIERLRGISLTESRQNTAVSGISWDEFAISGVFRVVSIGNRETEAPAEWYESGSPFSNFTIESEEAFSVRNSNNRRPPGLSKEALNALKHEVFRHVEGMMNPLGHHRSVLYVWRDLKRVLSSRGCGVGIGFIQIV